MNDIRWIKITTDMFDNRKIKAIRKLPEGNNIILIWVMLLSLAGRCNASGMIFLTENIPYTNKILADELGFEESVIHMALKTLEKFGMITTNEDMIISINNWDEYQNVEGMDKIREQTRKRVASYRKRKKLELPESDSQNACSDIKHFSSHYSNVKNLDYVLRDYPEDYGYITSHSDLNDCIKEWMDYKDQKKPKSSNHYDTERGIKKFLNKVIAQCKKYGMQEVIGTVNDSIASNYQGVIWDSLERYSKKVNDRESERETKHDKGYIQQIVESGGHAEFGGF